MKQTIKSQIIGDRAFMFFYGRLTVEGLIESAIALTKRDEFRPGMDLLCDARCASFADFSLQDLVKIGLAAERNSARRGSGGRSALVVGGLDRWTADMLVVINQGRLPSHLQIFDRVEEASHWLDGDGDGVVKKVPAPIHVTMPESVAWKNEYSIGHNVIDCQHRRLFTLVETFERHRLDDGAREAIAGLLQNLADYVDTHFQTEERLMSSLSYPLLDIHRAQHADLAERVQEMIIDAKTGVQPLSDDLSLFLARWLSLHINNHDRIFSQWCDLNEADAD
jgi:hemerythrin